MPWYFLESVKTENPGVFLFNSKNCFYQIKSGSYPNDAILLQLLEH